MRKWIVVCETYEGIEAKAVDLLTAEMNEYVDYPIPVLTADCKDTEKFKGDSRVILKTGNVAGGAEDGYLIEVKAEGDINVVEITANDKRGLYYGVVDFISVYVAKSAVTVYPNINLKGMFDTPFNCQMPEYRLERAPKIKNRAIWTWGHCILDYKKFIENMSLLKLNEIVVWNDYLPANAKEFVDCAHAYGIKVVWGFSWGWDTKCCKTDIRSLVGEEKTQAFANKILSYYEAELLPTGCDGIYFQSFTELTTDNIDGVNVAEAVTDLVNTVAAKLYEKYPLLEIQFGLHATSVFENLS